MARRLFRQSEEVVLATVAGPVRRPRLSEVAAEVGVSPATVSLVLRGIAGPSASTRERVLEAAARLGYRPDRAASALASRRSRSVGVLMDIGYPFHARLVLDLHEAAEKHGYNLVLSTITPSSKEERAINALLDSRCEALILLGPEAPVPYLERLAQQVPVVVLGRPVPSSSVDVVRTADDEGVAQAVGHLADLGHRRIAYLEGPRGAVAALRLRGYRRAIRRVGRTAEAVVVPGGLTEEAGSRAVTAVLRERPTGVVAFNDRAAVGLIDALTDNGIDVPAGMSVIGFDNSPIAQLPQIDLTTITHDTAALTEHAMAALIERLDDGRADRREVVVAPRLVVRGTTAPPAG